MVQPSLVKSRSLHGMTKTRLYRIFDNMLMRCYNPRHQHYDYYGGKGIAICDDWLDDKQNFFDWALSNGYTDVLSIDRIDLTKDYSPENCRWATVAEQARNTTRTHMVVLDGVQMCLKDAMLALGKQPPNAYYYINTYDVTPQEVIDMFVERREVGDL
jgi:hypothetical protein